LLVPDVSFLLSAMENDLSTVQRHLRQILAEAPGGRVLLSRLGARLREVLPGFSTETYGFSTLKALLQHATVPGKLVQTGPLEWWLVADGADPPAPMSAAGGSEAPVASIDQERMPLPRLVRVEAAWWRAVTEFDEGRRAWFDLQEDQLSTNAELAAAEPERFLAIPRFDLQAQRELARAWSEEQSSPLKENLLAALDAEPKLVSFIRAAEDAGRFPGWNERRMEVISSALLRWAKEHGIEP